MTRFAISFDSPVGRLAIAEEADAIVAIGWGAHPDGEPTPLLCEARRQLAAYFGGGIRRFDLPLAPPGSPFERRVWTAMQAIPYGETRRYGELAMELGSAPRAIGRACGRNPIPIVIPCHRVLARGGIGGYSGGAGLATKRALLALEAASPPSRELVGTCEPRWVGGSMPQV
jgi:methylated-DNA-[protein]-cysteine S-methyltransferase